MAVKEHRSYMRKEDRDLYEALSARRTKLSYKDGVVLPADEKIYVEEKLDIVPNEEHVIPDMMVSYEDVNRRSHERMIEHEDLALRKEQRHRARKLTARTVFETVVWVALIVLVGVFAMLLLYPQTELSELARDNSNLKDQINGLKTEILDAEENANRITDMDTIRAQALALGMQDPNQNQVVNLPVPNNDSLKTVVTYNTDGINDEMLADSEDALADYYSQHPEA